MLRVSSYKKCILDFKKRFGATISLGAIGKIIKKWNESAAIEDQHRGRSGRPKHARSNNNISLIADAVRDSRGRMSIRKMAAVSGMKNNSTWNILRKDLGFKPFEPTVSQKLSQIHIEKRLQFCKRMKRALEEEEIQLGNIIFTDESHIYLDDVPNKQNNRKWQATKPDFNFEKPFHSLKITIWVGMTANRIFGPVFFEDPVTETALTVNSERYVAMLDEMFDEETLLELSNHHYQQDGAPAHTSRSAMACLEEKFQSRLISQKSDFP